MVRVDDSDDVTKCWLDHDELQRLEEAAARADWEREIGVQLMGRCGFRADEVNYPGDAELHRSEKGECWFVEVRRKNTRGGEPKIRDAWMPEDVEANVRRFSRERGRETSERPRGSSVGSDGESRPSSHRTSSSDTNEPASAQTHAAVWASVSACFG